MNTYHIFSLERKQVDNPEIRTGHWERVTTRPGNRRELLAEYKGRIGQERYGRIKIRRV